MLLAGPSPVRACSGISCAPGTFFPVDGTVPANLRGIYWWPSNERGGATDDDGGANGEPNHVRLARVDGEEPELIDFTLEPIALGLTPAAGFLIVPETPFVAGARYVAWDLGCESGFSETAPPPDREPEPDFLYPFLIVEWSVARFDVAAAAALPNDLGALDVRPQEEGRVYAYEGAGCTTEIDVISSDVDLSLSSGASPWADALFYETAIDGEPYAPHGGAQIYPFPGTAMAGRAKELVYAKCDDEYPTGEGVDPGTHRIELSAHIPGELQRLVSNEERVTLTCPPADAGSDATVDDDDAGSSEGGRRDSGSEPRDDDDEARATGGGCDCSATGAAPVSNVFWIACAVLWLTRRRSSAVR